jgi:hypothetical protein
MDVSSGRPEPFPPHEVIARALAEASARIAAIGFRSTVPVEELKWWFARRTVHPQMGLADIIQLPWFVVHEVVGIDEWKRGGGHPSGPLPGRELLCHREGRH